MFAPCSVQKAGLDSGIAPCRRISCVLGSRRRLDIVVAVNPRTLHRLRGVLVVFIRVSLTSRESGFTAAERGNKNLINHKIIFLMI